MSHTAHHPRRYKGPADSHLAGIARQLQKTLRQLQRGFAYDTLHLDPESLREMAGILVDFAADLHCDTGIWKAYEHYNTDFFGAALPLITTNGNPTVPGKFHPDRFRHFLWVLYPVFLDGLVLSPGHQDLVHIANAASAFLADAFAAVPGDSGIKAFLNTPDTYGWDVKKKLIWLGTHSYLFRAMFARYMEDETGGTSIIGRTDDFLCQECTAWSGLGVIDILAEVLDISDDDRHDLRNWYERHAAIYRVVSVNTEAIEAVNILNDQPYRIRINMKKPPFKAGQFIFGSTVPWRGEWYWSGEQQAWDDLSQSNLDDIVKDMRRRNPGVVCRYSKEYEKQVRQRAAEIHRKSLAFHGKDLIVYPDGLSMAADLQRELRSHWESMPQEQVKAIVKKHGLTRAQPEITLPKDLVEQGDGVGVFLNPNEGAEIMTHYTSLITGLTKKGECLTDDEKEAISGFVESESISPTFVKRVVGDLGGESVQKAFMLGGHLPDYWLEYLLRKYKGHFYRKGYPTLSVI